MLPDLERKNNCLELLNKPAEMITVSSSTIYSPAHWSKSSRNEKRLHHPSKSSWATPDNFPNPNYIGKVRIITSLSSKITFAIHINFVFLAICFTKLCWRSCVETPQIMVVSLLNLHSYKIWNIITYYSIRELKAGYKEKDLWERLVCGVDVCLCVCDCI